MRRRHPLSEAAAVVVAAVAFVASCVTTEAPTAAPTAVAASDLDVDRTCDVIVDIDDAIARAALVPVRHRYEVGAKNDRHAAFGVMLAQATPEERFRAFHADRASSSKSAVGPFGECLVYGSWPRMGDEVGRACTAAANKLGSSAVLVEIAQIDSAITHRHGEGAVARADAALKLAPTCSALHVGRARAIATTTADARVARDAWAAASAAAPKCFRCLVEQAALEERVDNGPAGRAAAASLWEKALALAPDHADTLRRFAAATAGVDDARALRAWEAAIAAGARDYPTLLAAARLSSSLAQNPAEWDAALGYARRAADAAKDHPEARRLVITAALKKGSLDDAATAARALVDLVPDDVVANAALARVAVARNQFVDAVLGYDAAVAALDASTTTTTTTTTAVDTAEATAIRAEQRGLLDRLQVDATKAPKGSANAVANAVQRALQNLWRARIKTKGVTKGGVITVAVETAADGHVVATTIKSDAVGDSEVAAAAVAWLQRAHFTGGARRHTLEFTLQ